MHDWHEVQLDPPVEEVKKQAARCMDCGIPFCNNGCPLGNIIPDWNDFAYRDKWRDALERLHSTNNFPEFTGLVCPAPCEAACVLGINQDPVTIKQIEWEIIRRGWDEGWVAPAATRAAQRPFGRGGRVGPRGPRCGAAAESRAGHSGHGLREERPHWRVCSATASRTSSSRSGSSIAASSRCAKRASLFQTGVQVGVDLSTAELRRHFDAVLLCMGSEQCRAICRSPGRELAGSPLRDGVPDAEQQTHRR